MDLIKPSIHYKSSYIEYIDELGSEERYPFPMDFDHQDFPAMLKKIEDFSNGINLPEGFVPSTTLWLVDNDKLVGVTNMRHTLSKELEHYGGHIGLGIRPSCRGLGLGKDLMSRSIKALNNRGVEPVHIHCYKDNPVSAKSIVACGGRLQSELSLEKKVVQRYWVSSK
jgi:predicted acetyltransferase